MALGDSLTPVAQATWRRNHLLSAMPEAEQERLSVDLRLVDLKMKASIYKAYEPITHVYFPLDCVISVTATLERGDVIEVATTGAEGVAGLPAFLGATSSPHEAFCQVPGQALRLDVDTLNRFVAGDGALHDLLHRYTQAVMVFLAQNVACNRMHTADERCARWLAQTHDRVGKSTFPLTQEFLSEMLGVRRAAVSRSAQVLKEAGLIRYTRGQITVLDLDGLHTAACDCYQTVRAEFGRIPGARTPRPPEGS
ncbi:MAG: Crp/Fnr family transcriptional regulator [Actinomycetes bacterium]